MEESWVCRLKLSKTEAVVTIETKREYMGIVQERYLKAAKRAEKSAIIDEIVANLGIHRKAAIRLLRHKSPSKLQTGCGGRRSAIFGERVRYYLIKLWHAMGRMNSKKMREALPVWLPFYIKVEIPREQKSQLLRMSDRTIERLLKEEKSRWRRQNNTGTVKSRHLLRVPIRGFDEVPSVPGHIELDTVAHCGGSLLGNFVWTLTATDIFSGWTQTIALEGKHGVQVREGLFKLESASPFKWRAIYFDNGTEFLNDDVLHHFARMSEPDSCLLVYRSRPYKKNDQAHVEQKNWSNVRELWGYARINNKMARLKMNQIMRGPWQELQNFFVPQQHVVKHERIGSKRIRRLDKPKTPFERLLACPNEEFPLYAKDKLIRELEQLNPFVLRERVKTGVQLVYRCIDKLSQAPRRYAS